MYKVRLIFLSLKHHRYQWINEKRYKYVSVNPEAVGGR